MSAEELELIFKAERLGGWAIGLALMKMIKTWGVWCFNNWPSVVDQVIENKKAWRKLKNLKSHEPGA